MSAKLSLKLGVFWLQQQKTTPPFHHPLLLFPGDGCEDVQVEGSLLLACSPLLRRILLPLSCCNSSAMTVVLPSTTSISLRHLVQIVSQGSVTIASGELANFRDLLSLLEIDMDKPSSIKKVAVKRLREEWKLSPKARQRLCSPSPICSTSSTDSTLEDAKLVQAKTVQKIAAKKQELPNCLLPSSESQPASPKTKPLPTSSSRPPVNCIFCDITMPFGTDQNTYLQHLEVCPVRADFEGDRQQAESQVKRMKMNPITNSLPVKKVKFHCAEPGCQKEHSSKQRLADHHRGAHGAKKLKCEEIDCSSSFFTSRALRQHMWVKHGIGKGPQCDECGKKVIDVENLRSHQRAAHGAPKLLCSEPGCAKTFTYIQARSSHIRKYHKPNAF